MNMKKYMYCFFVSNLLVEKRNNTRVEQFSVVNLLLLYHLRYEADKSILSASCYSKLSFKNPFYYL